MALAGFAWTLSLVANYAETGEIRHRGEFPGRHAVIAKAPAEGSVIADFAVWLTNDPINLFQLSAAGITAHAAGKFFYKLVERVIDRNIGQATPPTDPLMKQMLSNHGGAVEALVAATEPSIRQTHGIIGPRQSDAKRVDIVGGHNIINTYDEVTRDYVRLNFEDNNERINDFTVAAFNVNSGHGNVFDDAEGRTVPISMSKDVLRLVSSTFTWGLHQYANKTGKRLTISYRRILAMDGTPKRYIVTSARRADG